MEYKYLTNNYRVGDSSFEVSAMLKDNSDRKLKGQIAIQNTILGVSNYCRGNNCSDVAKKESEILSPKYVYSQRQRVLFNSKIKNHKYNQKDKLYGKSNIKHITKKLRRVFSMVIQNMLVRHLLATKKMKIKKNKKVKLLLPSFLYVSKVDAILKHGKIKARYTTHPHVDAILKERQNAKYKGLSR